MVMPQNANKKEMHVIWGTGPLGRFTAEALLGMGYCVRLINRTGIMKDAPEGAELCKADILNEALSLQLVDQAVSMYFCVQTPYERWGKEFIPLHNAAISLATQSGAQLIAAGRIRGASVRGSDFFGPWESVNAEFVFRAALQGAPVRMIGQLVSIEN